jgi:hypothetical protein
MTFALGHAGAKACLRDLEAAGLVGTRNGDAGQGLAGSLGPVAAVTSWATLAR